MSKKERLKVYADLVEPLLAGDGNALLNLASEYPFRHEMLPSLGGELKRSRRYRKDRDLAGAAVVAEKLRKSVEEMPVRLAGSVSAR